MQRLALVLMCFGCGPEAMVSGWETGPIPLEEQVSKTNPPSGFSVGGSAVWGSGGNVDHSTAITSLTGDSVLLFTNATPAGNVYLLHERVACEGSRPYKVWAVVQANSTTAGHNVFVGIRWLDKDLATISDVNAELTVVDVANTWQTIGGILVSPSNARFMQFYFGKEPDNFTAYFDYADAVWVPYACLVWLTSDQAMAGSPERIDYDSEEYDYGGIYDNATNYRVTIPKSGRWSVSAGAQVDSLAAGDMAGVILYKNGSAWIFGQHGPAGTDTTPYTYGIYSANAGVSLLSAGDLIEVRMTCDTLATIKGHASQKTSFFSVTELD